MTRDVPPPSALRIGIVSSFMPPHQGGLEGMAEALFQAYRAAGWEVRWVASRVPLTQAAVEGDRIRVGCWNALERSVGVPWPVWGAEGARAVARVVRWADVLHLHDCLYFGSVLTTALAHRAGTPVLLSQHIGFVPYRSAILKGLEVLAYQTLGRWVLRNVSHIVFCSPTAKAYVTTLLGAPPAASTTIPYGIDVERFTVPSASQRGVARRSLGLPEAPQVVLFAGRLVEKKGIDLVVEVSRRLPAVRFLVVGDGPLRPTPQENLTWIGSLPPERMPMPYHAADVFLLPSYGEGMPIAILEAMASGLPVIASEGEPFAKLLEAEGGCLVSRRTAEALSEALERVWRTPGLAERLGVRGRELVMQRWDLKAMVRRYLALIQDLAKASSPLGGACGEGRW